MTDPSPDELPADSRDALIREQTERLGEQDRRLAAQAEQIAALEAMVADLRDRPAAAERAGSRNSGILAQPTAELFDLLCQHRRPCLHRLKLRVPGGKLRRHNLAVRLQLRDPGTQPRHLLRWRDTLRTGHDATMIRMFSP